MTTPRVTVPVEPTEEMIEAGNRALSPWIAPAMHAAEAYRAMLSAAPAPEGGAVSRDQVLAIVRQFASPSWCSVDRLVDTLCAALATREEAPAEAGGGVNWKAEYEAVCEARISDRQQSQEIINERDKWIVELIRECDALRAQPPARSQVSAEDAGWLLENYGPTSPRIERIANALLAHPPAREDAQPVAWVYAKGELKSLQFTRQEHLEREAWGWVENPLYTHPAPDALRVAVEALERIATVDMGGGFLGAQACRQVATKALSDMKANQKGGE